MINCCIMLIPRPSVSDHHGQEERRKYFQASASAQILMMTVPVDIIPDM